MLTQSSFYGRKGKKHNFDYWIVSLREAEKKVHPLVAGPLRGGGGEKAGALRKKKLFLKFFFFFCLLKKKIILF